MRILVTGAAGLIGSGIAERLNAEHDVIGVDLKPGKLVHLVADCGTVARWASKVGPVDAVVHVAALHAPHVGRQPDADFRRTNVEATSRLLDLALSSGASHFVLTSTTSLYGHGLANDERAVWVDELLTPEPRDIYDETKLEAEELVASAGSSMIVTSLRISRCFPEPADVMAWYRLHRGIDRRDVAEAHALALRRSGPAATYVISSATPFRREDVEVLARDARVAIDLRCPGLIERMTAKGWAPPKSIDRVYDSGLAKRELRFEPRHSIESCLCGDWDPGPSH